MILIDPARCSGCSRCEVSCSFFHTGRVSRSRARVRVVKVEELGLDYPVLCRQCAERYCTRCPESALEIGDLGQVVVSPTLCTGCGVCQALCPVGAIELHREIPYVCDLCGGSPRCVEACNLKAVTFAPEESETVSLREFKAKARSLSPEEKRVRFALARTKELRESWARRGA